MSIKVAFTTYSCPDWSLAQVLDATKRYGFDGVEMRLLDGANIPPNLPSHDRERVANECTAAGIPICCLGTSLNVATSATDADARLEAERDAAAYLELAYAWRAPVIRIFGGEPQDGKNPADVVEPMVDLLGKIGQRAEQVGIDVALETHDAFSASVDVMRVVDRVHNRAIGVLWDTQHPYRVGETVPETFDRVISRLMHVHVKDARKDPTQRKGWKLVPLGEGELPVREAITALLGADYDRWVSIEWEKKGYPELDPPEVALPHEIAVLRRWLTT